jgi:medium-chain acyl-[acyl-carrier-protein] hydrolase
MELQSRWMTCLQPNPQADLRLICFPYAAGSASLYQPLAHVLTRALPHKIEVWGVEYPGHGQRQGESLCTRFTSLVERAAKELAPLLTKPFAILGYSLGAVIAAEVVRRLERGTTQSLPPHHLYIGACSAPPRCTPPPEMPDVITWMNAQRQQGIVVHEQILVRQWPLFQADFAVRTSYSYEQTAPQLTCPITAFGGLDDSDVPEEALLAWEEQTVCRPFTWYLLPGGHFFLHTARVQFFQAFVGEIRRLCHAVTPSPVAS